MLRSPMRSCAASERSRRTSPRNAFSRQLSAVGHMDVEARAMT